MITIDLTPGTPRTNIWCDRCLTSAGYEVDVYHMTDDAPVLMFVSSGCLRCDDE